MRLFATQSRVGKTMMSVKNKTTLSSNFKLNLKESAAMPCPKNLTFLCVPYEQIKTFCTKTVQFCNVYGVYINKNIVLTLKYYFVIFLLQKNLPHYRRNSTTTLRASTTKFHRRCLSQEVSKIVNLSNGPQ